MFGLDKTMALALLCGAAVACLAAGAEVWRRRAGNWPWRLLAAWATRRARFAGRSLRTRFHARDLLRPRWWLPATGLLLAGWGCWFLLGHTARPEPLAPTSAVAVSSGRRAAGEAVPSATLALVAEKPGLSEFEQIMRARAARNLRLLEFGLVGAAVVGALGALGYRFGTV